MTKRTLFIYAILACSSMVLATAKSFAQQSIGTRNLTVVPPTVSVNVDPGGKTEGQMKLINDSDEALTFSVDTQDFIVSDPHGIPSILPPNSFSPKYSAAAWLGVGQSIFTINPHQKIDLSYYLQVPKDARPGGHYTALIFKPQPGPGDKAGSGTSVSTQIGTLFSVHVNGPITESAKVTRFTVTSFQEYGPVKLTTDIKNMGDSDILPKGTVTFYDIFGQKVASVYLDEHRIFPEAVRTFENSFGRHWMVGRFTARLLASYGAHNNLPLVAEVSFVIFPWKVTVVVLLVLVALVLGYFVWRRKKNSPHEPTGPKDHQPLAEVNAAQAPVSTTNS